MHFSVFFGCLFLYFSCIIDAAPQKFIKALTKGELEGIVKNSNAVGRARLDEMGKCCLLDMSCSDTGGCTNAISLFTYYSPALKTNIIGKITRENDLKLILNGLTVGDILEVDSYLKSKGEKLSQSHELVAILRTYGKNVGTMVKDISNKPNPLISYAHPNCDLCKLVDQYFPKLPRNDLSKLDLPYSTLVNSFMNDSAPVGDVEACVYIRNMNDKQLDLFHKNHGSEFKRTVKNNAGLYTLVGCMNSSSSHMDWFVDPSTPDVQSVLLARNVQDKIHQEMDITEYMKPGSDNLTIDFLARQLKMNPNGKTYVNSLLSKKGSSVQWKILLDARTDDDLRDIALEASKFNIELMRFSALQPSVWKLAKEYFQIVGMTEIKDKILDEWCNDWNKAHVLNITLGFMSENKTNIGSLVNDVRDIPFHHRLNTLKNEIYDQIATTKGKDRITMHWKLAIITRFVRLARDITFEEFKVLPTDKDFLDAFMFTGSLNPTFYKKIGKDIAVKILTTASEFCSLPGNVGICEKYHKELEILKSSNLGIGRDIAKGHDSYKFTQEQAELIIRAHWKGPETTFINTLGSFLVTP